VVRKAPDELGTPPGANVAVQVAALVKLALPGGVNVFSEHVGAEVNPEPPVTRVMLVIAPGVPGVQAPPPVAVQVAVQVAPVPPPPVSVQFGVPV
jgi:hypothetical protein